MRNEPSKKTLGDCGVVSFGYPHMKFHRGEVEVLRRDDDGKVHAMKKEGIIVHKLAVVADDNVVPSFFCLHIASGRACSALMSSPTMAVAFAMLYQTAYLDASGEDVAKTDLARAFHQLDTFFFEMLNRTTTAARWAQAAEKFWNESGLVDEEAIAAIAAAMHKEAGR